MIYPKECFCINEDITRARKKAYEEQQKRLKKFVIYQLDADGTQETKYSYLAETPLKAMKKFVYFQSLKNGNITEQGIYKTENGYGLNVLSTTYWIKAK